MSKPLDRVTLLETFTRIAERGSISAAARDLGLSQASASRQLASLEERLGAQLIRRTTHALSLTPAGEDCLADARALLASWDALSERYSERDDRLRGKLKVVAPGALGQLQLAEAAAAFQRDNPEVLLNWIVDDTPIRFAETGCDLWLRVGPVPDDTLIIRTFGHIERMIVAAPALLEGHTIKRPIDLDNLPFAALVPYVGVSIPLSNDKGRTEQVTGKMALSTNNFFAAYKAALTGTGFAVLPRWFVAEDLRDGVLVDVLPGWRAPPLTLNAAYLPARRQPARLRRFIDHIETSVKSFEGILVP